MATRDTYQVQEWEDLPSENTPISGERLGHMEFGIKDAMDNRALKEIYGDYGINSGYANEINYANNRYIINGYNNTLGAGEENFINGINNNVLGGYNAVIGTSNTVRGSSNMVCGVSNSCEGTESSAYGLGLIAKSNQNVIGKWNEEDAEQIYSHIVGGGTGSSNRKNLHTLDRNGNATYAGTVESQGLILIDTETEQKYKLTVANGNIAITTVE